MPRSYLKSINQKGINRKQPWGCGPICFVAQDYWIFKKMCCYSFENISRQHEQNLTSLSSFSKTLSCSFSVSLPLKRTWRPACIWYVGPLTELFLLKEQIKLDVDNCKLTWLSQSPNCEEALDKSSNWNFKKGNIHRDYSHVKFDVNVNQKTHFVSIWNSKIRFGSGFGQPKLILNDCRF